MIPQRAHRGNAVRKCITYHITARATGLSVYLECLEPDRFAVQGDVDFQDARGRDEGLQRARHVAHESDQDAVRSGWNVEQLVAAIGVGGREAIEIGE